MADVEPPPYTRSSRRSGSTSGASIHTLGFPTGYFLIRSMATGKVLDVSTGAIADGTPVVLWTQKEKMLVERFRDPGAENQVFFIDHSGALCSRPSGHAIDIEGDRLVLRHRRPVSLPFPNAWSHPMPRFSYEPETGHITVTFTCDPSYPPPGTPPSRTWLEKEYLLTSIPIPSPKPFSPTEFFASATSSVLSLRRPRSSAGSATEFALGADEIVEEDRTRDDEDDGSPAAHREVRMTAMASGWREKMTNNAARGRRRWEILPILT